MKFILALIAVMVSLLVFVSGAPDSEVKAPTCSQPKVVGPCRKAAEAFFYNQEAKQCEAFIYGGCQGNDNRFETKDECEKACLSEKKQ